MSMRLGGLVSGMDTASIVKQLMQAESAPMYQMQNKQHIIGLKKDLLSEVNSSLTTLQSKVQNLFKNSTFNPLKMAFSDSTKVNATLGQNALAGVYSLNVTQLATASTVTGGVLNGAADQAAKIQSTGGISNSAPVDITKKFTDIDLKEGATLPGNDTLTINGINFNFTSTMTVDSLLNQINGSAAGVTMSYDQAQDRFVIESKDTGANAKIDLSDKNGFFSKLYIAKGSYKGTGTADLSAVLNSSQIDGLAPAAGNTFYFKINGYNFNCKSDTDSLQKTIDTINKSGAGVVAFYDSTADKITITNKQTGNTPIQFEDVQGNFLQSIGVYDPVAADKGVSLQTAGKNAEFKLNGAQMTRTSNKFDLNGITFTLMSEGNSSVTVSRDEDGIYNSIKDFVNQYNSTMTLLGARLSETTVKDATTDYALSQGLLRGESSIMNVASSLREVATRTVSGLTNLYDSLMDVGITTDSSDYGKSGKLVIDDKKLRDAIKNNPDAVQQLFFADQNANEKADTGEVGVAVSLNNLIKQYVDPTAVNVAGHSVKTGILANELDTMSKQYSDYDKSIADFNVRLKDVETRYWNQFNAMEEAMSKLNDQGSWLQSQLASM